ncbi:cytochrome c5 family protein [Polynucleobacter sp. MG-5-Ahmo-C2]|jgi:mono/diheme cytochrome c family protein|uniref:c-type cytochrome n=1 Tax=Polynucleobacter sp. MG-5-Ahmo-C2 TaxID=2081051 RepID=UPI001BFD12CF|nr:c-type cytochrome [Polynucleobacter sp. MG-5-Ahmo-C2]QWD99078.1 cytochrome c5 family protein [Polynucleobacter sp. MG-5-Ahmo-C2]
MSHKSAAFLLFSFLGLFFSGAAFAQSGEATYKQVCVSCHGTGVLNAPKFGDKAKWAPLIAEGQVTLTAHAYFGVRAMPPKGGNPNLSIEGFSDALVYMVNNSGGNWKSPDAQTIAAINKEVEARRVGANKKR